MPACLSLQKTQKVGLARETIKVFPACVYLSRGELGIQIGSHGREELNRFCFSESLRRKPLLNQTMRKELR